MPNKVISIADDFTRYPGTRYRVDGPFSGEEFRDDILIPALSAALREQASVVVILDGVAGYGSSFLEEAFGGLLRRGLTPDQLRRGLRIEARTPRFQHHKVRAQSYIDEEAQRQGLAQAEAV